MSEYHNVLQSGTIGNVDVRNRLVMPPMGTNFADETGAVTDQMLDYYADRASGGAGLVMVEVAAVEYPHGKAITRQLRIDDDEFVSGLSRLADRIRAHGAAGFIQLHHAGRQTTTEETEGHQPVSASAVTDEFLGTEPRPLDTEEVEALVERFAEAADRAQRAGFDGVELHAAHGYLVGQFMSSRTNRRTDRYGGDLEDRMRFPLEIVDAIRTRVGDEFGLSVRISADEFVEEGNDLEDGKRAAKSFEDAGVDVVNVSSGTYESMPQLLEPMEYEEAWRTHLASEIGAVVDVPTIAVGVIRHPDTMNDVLTDENIDFVAVGRGHIADPEIGRKIADGRAEAIVPCISCNVGCLDDGIFASNQVSCTVNPEAGREAEFDAEPRIREQKDVLVVGAGPAGVEAATRATARGHDVTLAEQTDDLGGQLTLAAATPGKEKIDWLCNHLETKLDAAPVDVQFGARITVDDVREAAPDVVVVATGARPLVPAIEGIDREHVCHTWDLLADETTVEGDTVVVIGAGKTGCETAEQLAANGHTVSVLEMREEGAPGVERASQADASDRFADDDRITIHTDRRVTEIAPEQVITDGGKTFDADTVVLATGSEPNDELVDELTDLDLDIYVAGDAKSPNGIHTAIHDGCEIGRSIGAREPTVSPKQ
ncbi:oxidoreductase [Natronobacterium gregoryi]|uniref:FAD-dependent oxidoreductase n=2 Tax=Natronobacterium gregoryi TaxID=44930 RepID=L0AF18_NATGS|nr:FAD-dependent oxidoreductase [Natronobacterium gregoryi]AFZ72436.1 NADH:flavin oxidoreductase [Natronobacterium gregoryi SP2]PLK21411.1 FAD-dependent oxidoreductase [Natronobacterium gregoryi SP2]SFI78657.1 2,4-dienoyl-CoA reductase [Natronobacterium gregoryi]